MQTSITSIPYLYVGLFSSSPDKFRDLLGSFSTFSFSELSSKWRFLSCPGGGFFLKSNAEQKPQRHSFESQSRWTGEAFHLLKKIKHSWTEQILTTAGLSLYCAHFQTAQGNSRHSFGYILKNNVCGINRMCAKVSGVWYLTTMSCSAKHGCLNFLWVC